MFVDFPAAAFSCFNLKTSVLILNDSSVIQGTEQQQQIVANCSYSNVYPRHSLEVWYGDPEHLRMKRLATKLFWEATPTLANNLDNFDLSLNITL